MKLYMILEYNTLASYGRRKKDHEKSCGDMVWQQC